LDNNACRKAARSTRINVKLKKLIKNAREISEPYCVTKGEKFRLKDVDPADTGGFASEDKPRAQEALAAGIQTLEQLQDMLYAQDCWAVLLIFQGMDAAGKDGTIKHVMSGVNPQGCQVYSFKAPSAEELEHDFLWRCVTRLPERGNIGIFNRSYYEEVLVVRVHDDLLQKEKLPPSLVTKDIFEDRFDDIRHFERYLTRNGVVIRKFFLHISKKEQKKRFLERLENPKKLCRRRTGARALGRLLGGVRGYDPPHRHQARPLVRRAGGQQMVHAGRGGGGNHRCPGVAPPPIS
jgi:PPK2 family polyphosphate:nucleotide phosphotransferase